VFALNYIHKSYPNLNFNRPPLVLKNDYNNKLARSFNGKREQEGYVIGAIVETMSPQYPHVSVNNVDIDISPPLP